MIRVTGAKEFVRRLEKSEDDSGDTVMEMVTAITLTVHRNMIASFRTPKTGRLYGKHRASAPGQAPAIDTGELAAKTQPAFDRPKLQGEVATSDPKSVHLEYGTRDMAPRPYAKPAAEKTRRDVPAIMAKILKRRGI